MTGRSFSVIVSLLSAVMATAAPGCGSDGQGGGDAEEAGRVRGSDQVGGTVVATVDGVGISVEDVEGHLATAPELTPTQALAALVDSELLAAEARRRGYALRGGGVHDVRARGAVRRLLASKVEGVITPASIAEAAVVARYEREAGRYHQAERRRSRHLLVWVPEGADAATWALADARARELLEDALAAAPDVDAVFEGASVDEPLSILLESLEPMAQDGSLQRPYEDALFSTDAGELHPQVVRTSYGVHLVFVEEVVPAVHVSLEEATPAIREALAVEGRAAAVSGMLRRLGEAHRVEVNEDVFGRVAVLEIGP